MEAPGLPDLLEVPTAAAAVAIATAGVDPAAPEAAGGRKTKNVPLIRMMTGGEREKDTAKMTL